MNRLKEKKEEKAKPKKKGNKVTRSVVDVLNGNFLSKENAIKHLPYLFFLTGILICYIAYGYYSEKVVKDIAQLDRDLKELKSEETSIKSMMSFHSKQSQVEQKINGLELGLKVPVEPPYVIEVSNDQATQINE